MDHVSAFLAQVVSGPLRERQSTTRLRHSTVRFAPCAPFTALSGIEQSKVTSRPCKADAASRSYTSDHRLPPGLLPLDGLEQRLEVALAEPLRAVPLDQLEEQCRPVLYRLGEDLQQVPILVPV